MIYGIELDIAGYETFEKLSAFIWSVERYYGLKGNIVTMRGPGGGHPVVHFKGHKEDLSDFITVEYCDYDVEDADFYIEQLKAAQ